MDSVASFSFWVVGVMVMLAGPVLGYAVFCVLKSQHIKINSTQQKTKGPSSDLSVALDVFL